MSGPLFHEPELPAHPELEIREAEYGTGCRRKGCKRRGSSLITIRHGKKEEIFLVCDLHKQEYDEDNLPIAAHNQHAAARRIREKNNRDKYE
jgi:hypothetical protein